MMTTTRSRRLGSGLRLRSAFYLRFRKALTAATRERPLRTGLVDAPDGGTEVAWVAYERSVMLHETRRACGELGLPPVEEDAVARAESWAVGHHDYVSKFASYCADLVCPQPS